MRRWWWCSWWCWQACQAWRAGGGGGGGSRWADRNRAGNRAVGDAQMQMGCSRIRGPRMRARSRVRARVQHVTLALALALVLALLSFVHVAFSPSATASFSSASQSTGSTLPLLLLAHAHTSSSSSSSDPPMLTLPPIESGPYAVLGVSPTATAAQIRKAYLLLSKRVHPDKNPDPSAQANFHLVQHAYELLSDSQKRADFDRHRRVPADSLFAAAFSSHPSASSASSHDPFGASSSSSSSPFFSFFSSFGGRGGPFGGPFGGGSSVRAAYQQYQLKQGPFAPSPLFFRLSAANYAAYVTSHVLTQPYHSEAWLIHIDAESCSTCATTRARFEQVAKYIHHDVKLAHAIRLGTIHAQFEPDLVDQLGISQAPMFMLLTMLPNGHREVTRIVGQVSQTDLITQLNRVFQTALPPAFTPPLFLAHVPASYETAAALAIFSSHSDSRHLSSSSALASIPLHDRFRKYVTAQLEASTHTQVFVLSASSTPSLLSLYLAARLTPTMSFTYVAVPIMLAPSLHKGGRGGGARTATASRSWASSPPPSLSELVGWLRLSPSDMQRIASLVSLSESVFIVHQLHPAQPSVIVDSTLDAPTMLERLRQFEYPVIPRVAFENFFDLCVRSNPSSHTFVSLRWQQKGADPSSSPATSIASGHKTCLILFVNSAAEAYQLTRQIIHPVQNAQKKEHEGGSSTSSTSSTSSGSLNGDDDDHGEGDATTAAQWSTVLMNANVQVVWAPPSENHAFFTFFSRTYEKDPASRAKSRVGPLVAALYTPRTSEFAGFSAAVPDSRSLCSWAVAALQSRQQRLTGMHGSRESLSLWINAQRFGGPPALAPLVAESWLDSWRRWFDDIRSSVWLACTERLPALSRGFLAQLFTSLLFILLIFFMVTALQGAM